MQIYGRGVKNFLYRICVHPSGERKRQHLVLCQTLLLIHSQMDSLTNVIYRVILCVCPPF